MKVIAFLAVLLVPAVTANAASPVEAFYKGKSIDLIISTPPGGGYDIYARVIARHIDRYIPGNPTIIPKNMPGAGSNKATSFIYAVAPKDGTVIGATVSGVIVEPLIGDKNRAQHDPSKLIYLGSANDEVFLCVARSDAPVKKFADALNQELVLGADAPGGSPRDFPTVLNNVLGTKFNLVSGYPGTKDITLAIERKEIQGLCGYSWSSLISNNPEWSKPGGGMTILVQEATKGHPEMNKLGIPLAVDFAKTDEDRQILELIYSQLTFGRPYILPPGVPDERVKALRSAFDRVLKDKDLLADAARSRIEIVPVSGETVQDLVTKIYQTPPKIVERAREALIYKGKK
jgi:tripartite-type tricarboxylate transporter receptor subunit TctC